MPMQMKQSLITAAEQRGAAYAEQFGVLVAVGVLVTVPVLVAVPVAVRVGVLVAVPVAVAVEVGTGVGVSVGITGTGWPVPLIRGVRKLTDIAGITTSGKNGVMDWNFTRAITITGNSSRIRYQLSVGCGQPLRATGASSLQS